MVLFDLDRGHVITTFFINFLRIAIVILFVFFLFLDDVSFIRYVMLLAHDPSFDSFILAHSNDLRTLNRDCREALISLLFNHVERLATICETATWYPRACQLRGGQHSD